MAQISLKSLMNNDAPTYPQEVAQPFRDELIGTGFIELLTPADVDAALNRQDDKIILVMLNSVCGCAARSARPGTILSMLNETAPDEYTTVFAGMEKQAVNHFREKYLPGLTPSSPNIALFKNGQVVFILQRYQIEGRNAIEIAKELTNAYNNFCGKKKSPEEVEKIKNYIEHRYQVKLESLNL
ncbi:MAG TPA: BrxA/BrxB family bacilliredoxin [Chitinophagaceae bacterium]|jgi:putative YphP/YqiW family bacilliredoxin|nr:BrxA/BrxB family bacilliredoxin [Chitinophagaceae bacterium]